MIYLLGIDDTDQYENSDTSVLAMKLAEKMQTSGMARVINISCHQLNKHPDIAYTTNNISCCLLLEGDPLRFRDIDLLSREFMASQPSPKSNPGFVLASWKDFDQRILIWGKRAKTDFLTRGEAIDLGRACGLSIAGFTGNGNGVIGALAAVGLRFFGDDGWIEWMPGISSLQGNFHLVEILDVIRPDRIENERGKRPAPEDLIHIEGKVRPILKEGKTVLLLRISKGATLFQWEMDPKKRS